MAAPARSANDLCRAGAEHRVAVVDPRESSASAWTGRTGPHSCTNGERHPHVTLRGPGTGA